MKKRLWTGILAAALIVSICAITAVARGPRCSAWSGHHNAGGVCAYYADENGDGVCDHFTPGVYGYGRHAMWWNAMTQNGWTGMGLWHHTEDGSWAHCTDADNDGVCDVCGAAYPQWNGFTDANNDGVCDYYGSAICGGGHCGGHGGRWR